MLLKIILLICINRANTSNIFNKVNQYFNKNKKQECICTIFFTPYDDCTQEIVNQIDNAKHEILILSFAFTCNKIQEALCRAKARGVKIIILMDKKYIRHEVVIKMSEAEIPIYIDKIRSHAHNKVMIIDDEIVLTGSFNFTYNAQHGNTENSVHIESKSVAKQYKKYFYKRLNEKYKLK